MANKKISALDPLATPADGDILPITDVSDTTTSGSADGTTKGVTVANLMGQAPVQSVAGRTGVVTIANTDVSGLGTAATTASSDYATAAQGSTADTALQPTSVINDLSDVTITSASNEDVIKFNGTNFVNGQVSVDVDGPLNAALRGTDNPHIGAYPNQSFKVIDNPNKSVMVVADEAGNLKLLNSLGVNNIAVGFSVVEDGTEPDIEVVSGSETYSVISGDSDALGANGLPIRQGFNLPDIGANPAPILISGGSIA